MKLSDLRAFIKAESQIKDSQLDIAGKTANTIINHYVNQAGKFLSGMFELLPKTKDFNVSADKNKYSITTDVASDFLKIQQTPIYWNDGTDWKPLDGVTREYMAEEFPSWFNNQSGDPLRYWIEGESIFVHNTPDTTLNNGFRISYFRKPLTASDDNHYVFHVDGDQNTEIANFDIFDTAIMAYVEWKMTKIKSKEDQNLQAMYKQNFINIATESSNIIKDRPDIYFNKEARYQGMIYSK